jgi:hypothetical protein
MVQTSNIIIATAAIAAASSLARPMYTLTFITCKFIVWPFPDSELDERNNFVRDEDDLFVREEISPSWRLPMGHGSPIIHEPPHWISKIPVQEHPIPNFPNKIFIHGGLATRELDGRSWLSTAEKVGKGALKVSEHLPSGSNSQPQQPQQPQQKQGFFSKVGGFLGLREEDELSARDYEDPIYGYVAVAHWKYYCSH